MIRFMIRTGVVFVCAAVSASEAGMPPMGTPLVAIGENQPTSWTQAIQSGRLYGVNPETDGTPQAAIDFYRTQGNAVFVPATLTPDLMATDENGETHQSLVMQWNPLMQGEDLAVASFEYNARSSERVGGLDLRNGTAHFSVLAPQGVWDLSFILIDKNGLSCGWFRRMPPPTWTNYWLDFTAGDQMGWNKFGQPGFDLSNVTSIRLDEAGAIVNFPLPPPGSAPDFWDWNAFDHIIITPAPSSAMALALAGLVGLRRRRD